jgi:ligand-binding SRPBCC domain-containing protein
MMKYIHHFTVNASLAAVAAFHQDSRALRQLTPPPMWAQFHQVDPLAEGSVADFTMWIGPLPVRWTAVHTQVAPNGFTDTQQRGPFKTWQHRHTFQEINERTTVVIDQIEAEPGNLISRFMWLTLPILFAYRAWRTKRALRKTSHFAASIKQ